LKPFNFDAIIDLENICRMVRGKWRIGTDRELYEQFIARLMETSDKPLDELSEEELSDLEKEVILDMYREGYDICSRRCNMQDSSECDDFDINTVWMQACTLAGGSLKDGKCVFSSKVEVPSSSELCSKLGGTPTIEDGSFKCDICN